VGRIIFGMKASRRFAILISVVLVACTLVYAGKEFVLPRALPANKYPAHDEHMQEGVSVAVDPYDTPAKASIFHTNWREHALLPVQLIVSNDSDQPLSLTRMKVELITANRSKLQPATDDDLARRLSQIKRRGDEPRHVPFPIPHSGPKVGVDKETREEIDAAQFRALAVEPHTLKSGFLFFDIEGIREPLAGAHLYVSGVKDANGQELMFFEIAMDKYLAEPAVPK
jgi:hypothetical protein